MTSKGIPFPRASNPKFLSHSNPNPGYSVYTYSLVDAKVTPLNGWVGRCVDSWLADGRWIVGSVGELTGGSMGLCVSELIGGLENVLCQISFMATQ
jgi:hypothetical protein